MFYSRVFFASYYAWLLLEIWVFSRDRRRAQGRAADRGSLWTIVLAVFAGMFVAFWAQQSLKAAQITSYRAEVFWVGIALMWSGLGLRFWAIVTLGRFFRATVFIQDGHQLIRQGPYRLLRHPSYAGGMLTMIGVGLALTNWASLAAMIAAAALAYVRRIPAEEAALAATFGESFDAYRKNTWAVVPYVW